MKEIGIVKLVSGDVVMGRMDLEELKDGALVVEKPMHLMLDPTQGGVGMIPYDAIFTQIEQEEVTFRAEHIMHDVPVHSSFEEAYIKQTTGIETQAPKIEV
jgi:hypothetical protein